MLINLGSNWNNLEVSEEVLHFTCYLGFQPVNSDGTGCVVLKSGKHKDYLYSNPVFDKPSARKEIVRIAKHLKKF